MCDKNSLVELRFGTNITWNNRLEVGFVIKGRVGNVYELCPHSIDFLISHLTKIRKQMKSACKKQPNQQIPV